MKIHVLIFFIAITITACTKENEAVSSDCFFVTQSLVIVDSFSCESIIPIDSSLVVDVYFHLSLPCESFNCFKIEVVGEGMGREIQVQRDNDCGPCDMRRDQLKEQLILNFPQKGLYILSFNSFSDEEKLNKKIIVN